MHVMRPSPAGPSPLSAPLRAPALRDYQARVLRSLLAATRRYPGATLTVMFPRQSGKNEVAAVLVAALLQSHAAKGGSIVVCAPTGHPQAAISLERTRLMLDRTAQLLPAAGWPRLAGDVLQVGRARAVFLSASPAAHVAGHTASLALIADEAQDIDSDWFNRQFRPMAASTGAPAILFGTAWSGQTLLEEAARHNRERDARGRGPGEASWLPWHYQVSWQEVAASRPGYGDYVRQERARLGANHPLFRSQYELVPVQGEGRLFSAAQLARLEGGHERLAAPCPGERYVAGLDFGGPGDAADRTVLTIARLAGACCEVVQHVAWRGASFAATAEGVATLARAWRVERLCADATGLGAPLAEQLARDLGPCVEPVVFTAPLKSALGYALLAAAETGTLALYADDGSPEASTCRAELRSCEADLRPNRQLGWSARSGHDDYVASLALCLKAAQEAGPARVALGRRREA
jgi:hypothetical protein